jgi:hypothetical protein
VLLDARFGGGGADSYRAYRFPWTGRPTDRPAAAVKGRTVFVSWNGATLVTHWRVLGGDSAAELHAVTEAPKRNFETRIRLPSRPRVVEVQALDASRRVLRTSPAVRGG